MCTRNAQAFTVCPSQCWCIRSFLTTLGTTQYDDAFCPGLPRAYDGGCASHPFRQVLPRGRPHAVGAGSHVGSHTARLNQIPLVVVRAVTALISNVCTAASSLVSLSSESTLYSLSSSLSSKSTAAVSLSSCTCFSCSFGSSLHHDRPPRRQSGPSAVVIHLVLIHVSS